MFCPNCGIELDDDSRFCQECGTAIDAVDDEESEAAEATRVLDDDVDFGNPPEQAAFDGMAAFATPPDPTPTPNYVSVPHDTTYVAPGMQQPPAAAYVANDAAPATSGGKTVAAVSIIAVVAILIVAAVAFLMLRPTASAMHTVQYETDGGTAVAATEVEEGTQVTSPSNPTKSGYTFEGWYSNPECTDKVTFPFSAEEDIVLYAKWEEKEDDISPSSSSTNNSTSGESSTKTTTTTSSSSSTVTISVVGADGTTRTADIHRVGSTERVLPEGNSRRYSASEIASLSDAERCIAWNEIIAASNGYPFKNSGLASYFGNCSWYYRVEGASPSGSLSANASANVELLKSTLGDSWWLSLATW